MRGKAGSTAPKSSLSGITPACAGKSFSAEYIQGAEEDHPRVCGEKPIVGGDVDVLEGSPPRVRGKGTEVAALSSAIRITPACAGKRQCIELSFREDEDHPRVCGEKVGFDKKFGREFGSPPRVRGKARRMERRRRRNRITPACAGKRLKKAHKIKDFDPVPIWFHLVFRRFERWCSNLPTPDGNVPV